PLQLMRASDPNTFQPKIGFATRYGITANPFCTLDAGAGNTGLYAAKNYFYRVVRVRNIM
ncbi:MAG: ATP-binding protein, partial [Candidatus Roizmanbacteria bacterium]|nr:ATP-binding protein [Candidatus Roizmanbacteria bacterium]